MALPSTLPTNIFGLTLKNKGQHERNHVSKSCFSRTLLHDLLIEFEAANSCQATGNHRYCFANFSRPHRYQHTVNTERPVLLGPFHVFREAK